MNIVFCGGGTAGHITPNLVLAEKLWKKRDCFYVGTDGMEKVMCQRFLGKQLKQFYTIKAAKFQRKLSADLFKLPFEVADSVKTCQTILKDLVPFVVFSKGGYAAFPVVLAAKKLKQQVVVYECDATFGVANKINALQTKHRLSAFDIKGAKTMGMVLRDKDGERDKGLAFCGFDGKKPVLIVTGGSLGASALNDTLSQCAERLKANFDVFVICGKGKTISANVAKCEFCDCMADLYACADVALTRGGANTLGELTQCGVPFVCVPLRKTGRGEQADNAKLFCSQKRCGVILEENDLSKSSLVRAVDDVYKNRFFYKRKEAEFDVNGTNRIAAYLDELASGQSE